MFRFKQHGYMDEAQGDEGGTGDSGPSADEQIAKMQADLEAVKVERDRLAAKVGEANKHAKAAERAAAEEARKKAEAEGNHEQLYKSAMSELEREREEHMRLRETVGNKERDNAALKVATELADGSNAELLSAFIGKRLKYTEEGVKVTDESGNLTVSTLADLANEFKGSAKFASLIKGNQSAGGSANGGDKSGSGAAQTISRSEFDSLNSIQQRQFLKDGGRPVDD